MGIRSESDGTLPKVVYLDDYRPHLALQDRVTGDCHVLPVTLLENWANGELVPDLESMRAVANALLELLGELQ